MNKDKSVVSIVRTELDMHNVITRLMALNPQKTWTVTIHDGARRSLAQNAIYWSWMSAIGDYTGYTSDEASDMCKVKFLGVDTFTIAGVNVTRPKSSKLGVKKFTEYLDAIELFASSSVGITLHRPDDVYYDAMGYSKERRV